MTENTEFTLPPGVKFHLVKQIEAHKVIALNETRLLPHEEKYLEFHDVSGVILFERNVESLSQFGELVGGVTELLLKDDLPPLIMVDHEGDAVSVLRRLIGTPPSSLAVAMTEDPGLAKEVARETGREMRKLGVNIVLAPVADCIVDPTSPITGLRAFGGDPERVAEFVHATVLGFKEAGIVCCAKHFPGHGSTSEDSHETLPVVRKTREELARTDLVPFLAAIQAGVEMMMISHVAFPLGENLEVPASFDQRVIKGMLRDEFGFNGVVVTDALDMAASMEYRQGRFGGLAGGTERPLLAGADLLLYSQPIPAEMQLEEGGEQIMSLKVMEMIIHTLDRIIDRERIERKVEEAAAENETLRSLHSILGGSEKRILNLRGLIKEEAPAAEPSKEPSTEKIIRLEDYASTPLIYQTIAEKSLILANNPAQFVPVSEDTSCLLMPVTYPSGLSLKPQNLTEFLSGLRRHFPKWERTDLMLDFSADAEGRMQPVSAHRQQMDEHRGKAGQEGSDEGTAQEKGSGFIVPEDLALLPVFSSRGRPPEDWLARFEDFLLVHRPPLVIVTGWPAAQELPGSIGCLLTFGASLQVAYVTARVLAGEIQPLRKIPGNLVW